MGAYICDKCGKDRCHHLHGYFYEDGKEVCESCYYVLRVAKTEQGPITPARLRVLAAIKGFFKTADYPPTISELVLILCLSRPTIHEHIRRLVKDKHLIELSGGSRKYIPRRRK
jgi:DNA-binding MarR family transcriptional regulator